MSSRSRILANLNSRDTKAVTHPSHKQKNVHPSGDVNTSQRRTVNSFHPENYKAMNLFSSNPPKPTLKKKGKENVQMKQRDIPKGKDYEADNSLQVYQDTAATDMSTVKSVQKKDDCDLICDERASERYWELLAEERRKALKLALEENKQLADDIKAKEETIKCLQEEVADLKETVKHTEMIASVLENLLQEDSQSEESKLLPENEHSNQIVHESCTNAVGQKSAQDNGEADFETKCEEFANAPFEASSYPNVMKGTQEDTVDASNRGDSNTSRINEATSSDVDQQQV